jgi:hypothetical protein
MVTSTNPPRLAGVAAFRRLHDTAGEPIIAVRTFAANLGNPMSLLRCTLLLVFAVVLMGCTVALAADPAASPDDAFLNALKGKWTMTGMVTGKQVRYNATGERVLQGEFLRLHMIDAAATPSYEADVYLGFDARQQDYIVHCWIALEQRVPGL